MELAGFNLFQPTDVFTLDISAKGGYTLPAPSRWIESHGFDQVIEHEAYLEAYLSMSNWFPLVDG